MKANFKPRSGVVYPFDSENFFNAWGLWLAYRREIKKPIKGIISYQAQLRKLSRLANLDEEKAIAIIEQSIENTWQGLFQLKINYTNGRQTSNNTDVQLNEALRRRFAT